MKPTVNLLKTEQMQIKSPSEQNTLIWRGLIHDILIGVFVIEGRPESKQLP